MRNWFRKRQLLHAAKCKELEIIVDEMNLRWIRFFGWSDKWHHVAVTVDDAGVVKVFKNGTLYGFPGDKGFIAWLSQKLGAKKPLTVEFWQKRK